MRPYLTSMEIVDRFIDMDEVRGSIPPHVRQTYGLTVLPALSLERRS